MRLQRREHHVERFWHLGALEDRGRIAVEGDSEVVESWRSEVFGAKQPA